MTALPEQNWHEAVMSPRGMYTVMKTFPEFQKKETDLIAQSIQSIDDRKALAGKIASMLMESMPTSESHNLETLEAQVLKQLDELQALLTLEQQEVVRKADRMAAIEKDPEKKSLLTRATNMVKEGWESAKNNKFKVLFALSAIAGGFAVWYYWDYLALLFAKAGFGAAGAAETGIAGGAEVAAEGLTQAEAVGAAVENALSEAALHSNYFAIVEHDLFYKGVKYSLSVPQDVDKVVGILKELGGDPDVMIRVLCSNTARPSVESKFLELMSESLPKAVLSNNQNPVLSTFIEDMADGVPLNVIP